MPVDFSPSQRSRIRRLAKYASVSLVSTATSLTILGVLVGGFGFPAVWANVIAIALGTVPSFELNRRWVWSLSGQRVRAGQVVPFCILSFSGLLISSVAVHVASAATTSASRVVHVGAVEFANIGSYGALWAVQFVLCEKVLFRVRTDAEQATVADPLAARGTCLEDEAMESAS
ncbi:MAG: hypothetical protein JWM85_3357 [Acidimicrobiaceae bacterium]|nr:hypothetical protein [Acidimicrobiaceae bacterium]